MNSASKYHPPSNGAAGADAINMLTTEHSTFKYIFRQCEKFSDSQSDAKAKYALVQNVCNALRIHMEIEEEIFYPAVHLVVADDDLMDDAEIEHAAIRELIDRIDVMRLDDERYDTTVIALAEQVARHVKEEETEMFPMARESTMDMQTLGAKMLERKMEMMAEMGITEESWEPIAPVSGKRSRNRPSDSKIGF